MNAVLQDLVSFEDRSLQKAWAGRKVPMSDLYEAYVAGRVDIPADSWHELFRSRHETLSFRLTESHVKWALTNFLPEVLLHSRRQDSRIVGDHYNRGNDFFGWFLGEAMVYTAAHFASPDDDLEQAQYRKIDRCCQKLRLAPGERLLDIGCGWGTFAARAARDYGVSALGITLAEEQVSFGLERARRYGVGERVQLEVRDYRALEGRFDKIVSLEMVEHVGIKNLSLYFEKVSDLLADDGLFVLQWTGIRKLYEPRSPLSAWRLKPEDLIWALFMNRHIFSGADASLPLSSMLRAAEDAGFEIVDVEPMSVSYVLTLRAWSQLWEQHQAEVVAAYGQRWFRLWRFFLHWSALIGEQGSALTYQVLMHKNHDAFARRRLHFG
ncbi:MAG TPA: cyclopropane-fatty-acyl-phospholipid synthase family protein [Polyangiaceae bacterium]